MIRDLEMWTIICPGYRKEWIAPHFIRSTKREAIAAFVEATKFNWRTFKKRGYRAARVIVKVAP